MSATKVRQTWNNYTSKQTERHSDVTFLTKLLTKFITPPSQHISTENAEKDQTQNKINQTKEQVRLELNQEQRHRVVWQSPRGYWDLILFKGMV